MPPRIIPVTPAFIIDTETPVTIKILAWIITGVEAARDLLRVQKKIGGGGAVVGGAKPRVVWSGPLSSIKVEIGSKTTAFIVSEPCYQGADSQGRPSGPGKVTSYAATYNDNLMGIGPVMGVSVAVVDDSMGWEKRKWKQPNACSPSNELISSGYASPRVVVYKADGTIAGQAAANFTRRDYLDGRAWMTDSFTMLYNIRVYINGQPTPVVVDRDPRLDPIEIRPKLKNLTKTAPRPRLLPPARRGEPEWWPEKKEPSPQPQPEPLKPGPGDKPVKVPTFPQPIPAPKPQVLPPPVKDPEKPKQEDRQDIETKTPVLETPLGETKPVPKLPPTLDAVSGKLSMMNQEVNLIMQALKDLLDQGGGGDPPPSPDLPGTSYRVDPLPSTGEKSVKVDIPSTKDVAAAVLSRLDAIAALQNVEHGMRRSVARVPLIGNEATITFLEESAPVAGLSWPSNTTEEGVRVRRMRKKIGVRVRDGVSVEDLWQGIKDISFTSGGQICGLRGSWGEVQIWASSQAQAEATAEAILLAAGWGADDIAKGERWTAMDKSYAHRQVEMRPGVDRQGRPALTMRPGPHGKTVGPRP